MFAIVIGSDNEIHETSEDYDYLLDRLTDPKLPRNYAASLGGRNVHCEYRIAEVTQEEVDRQAEYLRQSIAAERGWMARHER